MSIPGKISIDFPELSTKVTTMSIPGINDSARCSFELRKPISLVIISEYPWENLKELKVPQLFYCLLFYCIYCRSDPPDNEITVIRNFRWVKLFLKAPLSRGKSLQHLAYEISNFSKGFLPYHKFW